MVDGSCQDCPEYCASCSTPFGECLECINDSFELASGECACPTTPSYIDYQIVDNECIALEYCGPGTYNDGDN